MPSKNRMQAISAIGGFPAPVAVRGNVGGAADLWYFHSPKNSCRYVFCGVLVFLQAILLEADLTVKSYKSPGGTGNQEPIPSGAPHLISANLDGSETAYLVRYDDGARQSKATKAMQAVTPSQSRDPDITVVTDKMLTQRYVEIDNWIFLCAAMNRVRMHPVHFEVDAISRILTAKMSVTLGELMVSVS